MVPSRVGCGGFQLECFMDDHAFVLSCLRATLRRTLVSYATRNGCFFRSRRAVRVAPFVEQEATPTSFITPATRVQRPRGCWRGRGVAAKAPRVVRGARAAAGL